VIYVKAFFTSCLYVFLRAFQQQTVIRGNYWLVTPVSMAMGWCDVYLIFHIAKVGGWIWLATGAGGALGCMAGMYLHRRYFNRDTKTDRWRWLRRRR
jgi:hypothetical protein